MGKYIVTLDGKSIILLEMSKIIFLLFYMLFVSQETDNFFNHVVLIQCNLFGVLDWCFLL